jgi:hypothetical protein
LASTSNLAAATVNLAGNPKKVLHVMADLVRMTLRLRKLPRGA